MKLFKIRTFGCKVNQYESQVIREGLLSAGFQEAEDGQRTDLCIVNTCTVTAKADKESREALRRFLREDPKAEVVAGGCYVEADSTAIKAIDEKIRLVGNEDKFTILDSIKNNRAASYKPQATSHSISYFKGHTRAFVKIQDGCDNFCSYCKVPYVRGRSRSRNPQEVLKEAERLIRNSYKELVLAGICLGDFGKGLNDQIGLAWLIRKISDIEGDFRLRLSSVELPDVSDELIEEMRDPRKLCPHLHIPLQSGDDEILKKMNRRYTASQFIDRIAFIRSKVPDIAITTDIIAGFPDEAESNFENTLDALREIRPSRTHIFKYSSRQGTRAFEMADNIHPRIKNRRFEQSKELTDRFAEEFRLKSLHKEQRVLIEDTRDKKTGLLTGYTDTYIKVLLDGPDELMGRLTSIPPNHSLLQAQI